VKKEELRVRMTEIGMSNFDIGEVLFKHSKEDLERLLDFYEPRARDKRSPGPWLAVVLKKETVESIEEQERSPGAILVPPCLWWQRRFLEDTVSLMPMICPYWRRIWGLQYKGNTVKCCLEKVETGEVTWFFEGSPSLADKDVDRSQLSEGLRSETGCGHGCVCYAEKE